MISSDVQEISQVEFLFDVTRAWTECPLLHCRLDGHEETRNRQNGRLSAVLKASRTPYLRPLRPYFPIFAGLPSRNLQSTGSGVCRSPLLPSNHAPVPHIQRHCLMP